MSASVQPILEKTRRGHWFEGRLGSSVDLRPESSITNCGVPGQTAHYAVDANHKASDGSHLAITIAKATSTTTTVGAGLFFYDGTTQTGGSGTVTGAGGLNTTPPR
jgi:hypothetical protein